MADLNDIFKTTEGIDPEQDGSGGGDFAPKLSPEVAPEGTELRAEIVWGKGDMNKDGTAPKFNFALKVVGDEDKTWGGHEFYQTLSFSSGTSDNQVRYNAHLRSLLEAAGITGAFAAAATSNEAIAKACLGAKVDVKVRWDKPKADGKIWLSSFTSWKPVADDAASGGYVPQF